jgi:uncharacterized heparinase superfamily protein
MRAARVLRKPPRVVLQRLLTEVSAQTDRFRAPRRARAFDINALLGLTAASSLQQLWARLADRSYAIPVQQVEKDDYEVACPGDRARIVSGAACALAHRVDLLGSGPVDLGSPIDWHTDFKTGYSWPPAFARDIDYANLDRPSDVKVPWELSRLHWLLPAGQAYLLSGDERYASAVRAVLEDWMAGNPYAHSVNWACTMEVAMRILSWTWFFHVFCRSLAWADEIFQARFLRTLFLHGEFAERYLERSDINGNHFTADAAAMVFAGLFFAQGVAPCRWSEAGWQHLCQELPRQVFSDGVDFEASVAYHRLVLELFFLAARYRETCGLAVPDTYRERVIAMARFTQAYSRRGGSSPLVGDADDARALPFGGQTIEDHRYVTGLVGVHWNVPELTRTFTGPRTEIFWVLGPRPAASLAAGGAEPWPIASTAFPEGGFYVMRNDRDHVFIDGGPVGQAGRGGHGHNDCLSFEAVLDGVRLVSDCGAYVYTASPPERNNFRSTAYHNTPQVDGEEINRFVQWDHLWTLHNDAVPLVRQWEIGPERDVFVGTHTGYHRLPDPVSPVRTIMLDHVQHALLISDEIEGTGEHSVTIPLHLAAGVGARREAPGRIVLSAGGKEFVLLWSSADEWQLEVCAARISPSYGIVVPSLSLAWQRRGHLPCALTMSISPHEVERPGNGMTRGASQADSLTCGSQGRSLLPVA